MDSAPRANGHRVGLCSLLWLVGLSHGAVAASDLERDLPVLNRTAVFLDGDDRAEIVERRQANNWSFHIVLAANGQGDFAEACMRPAARPALPTVV